MEEIVQLREQLRDARLFRDHVAKLLGVPATYGDTGRRILAIDATIKAAREFYTAATIVLNELEEHTEDDHFRALVARDDLRDALLAFDAAKKKEAA